MSRCAERDTFTVEMSDDLPTGETLWKVGGGGGEGGYLDMNVGNNCGNSTSLLKKKKKFNPF